MVVYEWGVGGLRTACLRDCGAGEGAYYSVAGRGFATGTDTHALALEAADVVSRETAEVAGDIVVGV